MTYKFLLSSFFAFLCYGFAAYADTSSAPLPRTAEVIPSKGELQFLHNKPTPYGWFISYGPVGDVPHMKSVDIETRQRNGFVLFSCNEKGDQELVASIAGFTGSPHQKFTLSVAVGGVSHELPVETSSQFGGGGMQSLLYAHGDDVAGLLNALANVPDHQDAALHIMASKLGTVRHLYAPSINPHDMALWSASLCVGWHNQEIEKQFKIMLKTQKLH